MCEENLFDAAWACLSAADPDAKLALTARTAAAWAEGRLVLIDAASVRPIGDPGRPPRPRLVPPRALPRRSLGTDTGRGALIHAICHIEFNAINLAWDAVYRFRGMPNAFYADWIGVAAEEAMHFGLLREHLRGAGYDYGDFDAHNGLWEMAVDTAHDPLVRMALVPRVLEARGLDVTPGIMQKLQSAGDARAVEILEIILRDEVGHVAVGTRWYRYLCERRGLAPEQTFVQLLGRYMKGKVKGPFHRSARLAAGFSERELSCLENAG